jgi:hypothetical protein
LNDRLAELGKSIKDQQEKRAEKKLQKSSKGGLAGMTGVKGVFLSLKRKKTFFPPQHSLIFFF